MIDAATAILIPALPLGIAAGIGWMRCARMLAKARGAAAHWYAEAGRQMSKAGEANRRAFAAEASLGEIKLQRSETTRKGNITRAAKRKALQAAKTQELREQLTASVGEAVREAA